ncbi:orotidine-5'-phosphate decarboxylase [Candidatus Woesearchaeota archaeon]|nr:orotidine-5'-phosphate decarboxylase [Candidatus Woesearchaeota archaeon]
MENCSCDNFDQEEFNQFVIRNQVIGFKEQPITLKSGRVSHWYVNWRTIASDVHSLLYVAKQIIAFTKKLNLNPDQFYGVPEGATPLGVLTQVEWAKKHNLTQGSHPLMIGRAKPKEHGDPKDRYFVGKPGLKIIVIEDVTTTGGSLINTIKQLTESGLCIIAAYGLTNRNEKRDDGKTVEEAIKELGIPYFALSNALTVLPLVAKTQRINPEILLKVEKEFENSNIKLELGSSIPNSQNAIKHNIGEKKMTLTFQEQQARQRLCLPLDGLETLEAVRERVEELHDYIGLFKVGKASFSRFGPEVVRLVQEYGANVFLDLKYHDIPATVEDASKAAASLGVYMFNVHAEGGKKMMQAAMKGAIAGTPAGAQRPYVIGVTVLTSIDEETMNNELNIAGSLNQEVLRRAQLTHQAGLDGIVCSAQDLTYIKPHLPSDFMYITPGIQGVNTSAGSDQARVATPSGAVAAGSSILVVGRAITAPKTPAERQQAAYEILKDMATQIEK